MSAETYYRDHWLDVDPERVSLKGKTGEHVGPIGQEEAIAAQCVVLLVRR